MPRTCARCGSLAVAWMVDFDVEDRPVTVRKCLACGEIASWGVPKVEAA